MTAQESPQLGSYFATRAHHDGAFNVIRNELPVLLSDALGPAAANGTQEVLDRAALRAEYVTLLEAGDPTGAGTLTEAPAGTVRRLRYFASQLVGMGLAGAVAALITGYTTDANFRVRLGQVQ
jgi:hypothetical protein